MNERIKELADKCYGPNLGGDWDFNEMKFAQLIVQECLDQIEAARFELPEPVIKHVRKHFGV